MLFPANEIQEACENLALKKVKSGDLWILGTHRLLCGDCTNPDNVNVIMQGVKANLVITDPPYNIKTSGGGFMNNIESFHRKMKDIKFISNFESKEFLAVLPSVFPKKTMNAYIFCNRSLLHEYLNFAVENNFIYNVLIWDKGASMPLGGNHRSNIEYIVFVRRNSHWNNGLPGVEYGKVLKYERDGAEYHPTQKPVELLKNEILISSPDSGVVVDFFGGGGSVLLACELTGRRCYTIEVEPKYCAHIIARWEKLTGKTAVKEG